MALEIPTRLGRATGISGRKTSRTVRKCIQKSDHRERRGVAFGVAGSLVCRRREHLQLSRLDGSAFGARPTSQRVSARQRCFNENTRIRAGFAPFRVV